MSALMHQGSREWHAWRAQGIGASDVPIILGISPWSTPRKLWEIKTGKREPDPENFAMRRGHAMEAKAREAYESMTGNPMQPAERVHHLLHFMRASLDGITLDGSLILEVKCPGAKSHAEALAGRVPEHYMPQVQAQLFVSAAQHAHYWSFDGSAGVLVEVEPDIAMQERIVTACTAFWKCVQEDTPPPDSVSDERADAQWARAAQEYSEADQAAREAEARKDDALAALKALAPDGGKGCGITLSKVERAGSVDYARACKQLLPDFDFEPYRKAGTVYYSARIEK